MKFSCLLLSLAAALPCPAAPVPLVHLDAATQPELRQKQALPPLSPNQAVDIALARAGDQIAAFQSALAAHRPLYVTNRTQAFLRFDGTDDFLSLSGPRRLAPAVTVFILAAPLGNKGYYPGLFACAEAGRNDYTSGLNFDLGSKATKELSFLNLESAGAGGERDLLVPRQNLAADLPFGGFHVFSIRSQIKPKGNEVWLDGVRLAVRDRSESNIGLDQMVIGARYYSNDPAQQPFIDSFFHGDIAEVMVFDSALPDDDVKAIEQRLFAKVPELNAFAQGRSGHMLQAIKDPPPVQMLVPGFSVSELPVKLTNRNNLRYRHDGKLVALGYDGTIHLLTDTDGDGLEDKAEVFWDHPTMRGPLGIALTAKDDPRGDGVFVPSKGKVSLILDRDRDGKADEEIIVATGWQEITQNVDAVGIAIDPKDSSIYFGLGTANYANAYLIDPATGKAAYDIKSERGTIQRVSPDFKKRETVCTGVRFTCALGFNREGDLFATEQEGATWLPNGNPLDELLHIQPGKHYGFPPRHPKHLPDVLDWPAVMEYGPQHQSTVGMVFNEGVNGGPIFGPDFWAGDALICGESRGKLYRTKLVKTPDGYVAQNHLIACLGLLTVDACVTPRGELLIACHSGPPDWGTGPKGAGRIFKITYTGREVPQPVWQWASAPDEFRIAFDKELKPEDWAGLVANMSKRDGPNFVESATAEGSRGLQPTGAVHPNDASRERRRDPVALSIDRNAGVMSSSVADATRSRSSPEPWAEAHGYPPVSLTRQAAFVAVPDSTPPPAASPARQVPIETASNYTPPVQVPGSVAPAETGKGLPPAKYSGPILKSSSSVSNGLESSKPVFMPIGAVVTILPKRRVSIEAGRYVAAGDRYEVIRPGYQVVRDQMAEPRREVPVLGLSLTADHRTLVLKVPRQTEPVGYAVTLPLPESWMQKSAIEQKPEMDVLVTLNGVEHSRATGGTITSNIIPTPSLKASRAFLAPVRNDFGLEVTDKDSSLHGIAGAYNPLDIFSPVIQPGAKLDWNQESSGSVLLVSQSQLQTYLARTIAEEGGEMPSSFSKSEWLISGSLSQPDDFNARYELGSMKVPAPLTTFLVPWTRLTSKSSIQGDEKHPALPGNWLAGRRVFFSTEAACFTCHQIRNEGIAVGPDLTNLIFRDHESVLRDILDPSATINPDHPASTVTLKSGGSLKGIVRHADEKEVTVALQSGLVQVLSRADVVGTELLKTSFMPDDYAKRLTKEQQDDLLKYLLTSPLEPAPIERTAPPVPAPRKMKEVEAIIGQLPPLSVIGQKQPPLKILLSAGPKDHGPGEHDYPLWQKRWAPLLRLADNVTVDTAWEFPTAEQLAAADVTVFFSKNPGFNPRTAMLLDDYQKRGGGLVYLHWAVNGDEHADILAERIGLAGGKFGVKYRHGEFDLVFPQADHPVTKHFPTLHFTDETYWALVGDAARINVLGNGVEEGEPRPQLWSVEREKGRVIGCVPGHYTWTFDDPLYRLLVLRSICWTAKQENVDRLSELSTVGARVVP